MMNIMNDIIGILLAPMLRLRNMIHVLVGYYLLLPSQMKLTEFERDEVEKGRTSLYQDYTVRELEIITEDGMKLDGMYVSKDKNMKSFNETVILFPGNGEHYELRAFNPNIAEFVSNGINIVLFNYRGVGRSSGRATCKGLVLDGIAVLNYVLSNLGVPPEKVILWGTSMGGGVAGEVAAHCSFPLRVIFDRTYTTLVSAVKSFVGYRVLGLMAALFAQLVGWNFENNKNFLKIKGKKLCFQSRFDGIIGDGARLADCLSPESRRKCVFYMEFHGEEEQHMRDFTEKETEEFIRFSLSSETL